MAIDHKSISSWVRQSRYRAKKHNIYSDLGLDDVHSIIEEAQHRCAYCSSEANTLDCPFPLKSGGPHTPANVVPCCQACKKMKGTNDIVWMYSSGHIQREKYLALIEELCARRGGDLVKAHVRNATGLVSDE